MIYNVKCSSRRYSSRSYLLKHPIFESCFKLSFEAEIYYNWFYLSSVQNVLWIHDCLHLCTCTFDSYGGFHCVNKWIFSVYKSNTVTSTHTYPRSPWHIITKILQKSEWYKKALGVATVIILRSQSLSRSQYNQKGEEKGKWEDGSQLYFLKYVFITYMCVTLEPEF